jgi:hypothetical protein
MRAQYLVGDRARLFGSRSRISLVERLMSTNNALTILRSPSAKKPTSTGPGGLPLEELLFGFSFAMYWSSILRGRYLAARNGRGGTSSPLDHKRFRCTVVIDVIVETLKSLKSSYPMMNQEHWQHLLEALKEGSSSNS